MHQPIRAHRVGVPFGEGVDGRYIDLLVAVFGQSGLFYLAMIGWSSLTSQC